MKPPRSLGEAILWLRTTKGWTDGELGQRSGLARTTINDFINNRCYPSLGSLIAIARAFNLAIAITFYNPAQPDERMEVLLTETRQQDK